MRKNNVIFQNAMLLFAAMTVIKIIGALFKIPLGNILGGLGMSYFSSAFSVFQPIFALTCVSLPTVMTRLIAQNIAQSKHYNIKKIKSVALKAATVLGLSGMTIIFFVSSPFAKYVANAENSITAMLLFAPAVLFCCIASVYRGYFEGLNNMLPTAISQIIESTFKALLGVAFAYITLERTNSLPLAAAAAVLGLTISEALGALSLYIYSRWHETGKKPPAADSGEPPVAALSIKKVLKKKHTISETPDSTKTILKSLLKESLPITAGAIVITLSSFIDLLTITNCINVAIGKNLNFFLENFTYGFKSDIAINDIGNFIYGSYNGIVLSLFGLIPSMTAMVSKSALTSIAAAWEQKNRALIRRNLNILLKGTLIIGFPLCLGMAVLAEPILNLLYFARPDEAMVCVKPLIILSTGGIFLALTGALFNIFQAIGRADLQIKIMVMGGMLKLGGNLLLIPIPELNISGAAISTLLCYTFISVTGLITLKHIKGISFCFLPHFTSALINSLLCAGVSYMLYHHLPIGGGEVIKLATSVAAGAAVYIGATLFVDRKAVRQLTTVDS
ncbi:MAG: polysaccharide biosynthesis C-terminal domain-containing protein [Oscillospiraceae bacterium]|nr:polysaccharide biosynthesis C-terminal domain-containing protein [Oscillospiraceae bacterium]